MASASMKDIKRRIKSVESTMQITKAMELVASSKLRKAKEKVEVSEPYFDILYETLCQSATESARGSSAYVTPRAIRKRAYIVIGGDRGLAGGYNSNLFKFASAEMKGQGETLVIPIGRKAVEYFERRKQPMLHFPVEVVEEIQFKEAFTLGQMVAEAYKKGEYDELYVVYTSFINMLEQRPTIRQMLPLQLQEDAATEREDTIYEPTPEEFFELVVPQYLGGILYGAVVESFASEQGARRTAMENATDNAEEMISTLNLSYNRARQGAITQELTEIVAGANALNE